MHRYCNIYVLTFSFDVFMAVTMNSTVSWDVLGVHAFSIISVRE
jgi:hypothetical protein